MANHRVLGRFKSETGSAEPKEFAGLRAKMYSLRVPGNKRHNKIRVKGVKRAYVRKNVCHEQFIDTLTDLNPTSSRFHSFVSRQHTVRTVEICKSCLNAFDDKHYLLDDGVHTLVQRRRRRQLRARCPRSTTLSVAASAATREAMTFSLSEPHRQLIVGRNSIVVRDETTRKFVNLSPQRWAKLREVTSPSSA